MNELSLAERAVNSFLRSVVEGTRLNLTFTVTVSPDEKPPLSVEFRGRDTALLVERNGDLLESLRYLANAASGMDIETEDVVDVRVAE
jgi:predicted RNA-binding protein Jag